MDSQNSVIQKKVCLLGEFAIGKTSLVRRFVYNIFDERYLTTIGVSICRKEIATFDSTLLNLVIWDLASSDKYEDLRSHYLHGTAGALLVCDLTRPETIEAIRTTYVEQLLKNSPDSSIVLVGNKKDLINPASDAINQLEKLALELDTPFQTTSAKTGENVEAAFTLLANLLHKTDG